MTDRAQIIQFCFLVMAAILSLLDQGRFGWKAEVAFIMIFFISYVNFYFSEIRYYKTIFAMFSVIFFGLAFLNWALLSFILIMSLTH